MGPSKKDTKPGRAWSEKAPSGQDLSRDPHFPKIPSLRLAQLHCLTNQLTKLIHRSLFWRSLLIMADSPGSTLSSIASDEFPEDIKLEDVPTHDSPSNLTPKMPPSKRRRTGATSYRYDRDHQTPISSAHEADHDEAPPSPTSTISSDTSGEVPSSPQVGYVIPDEDVGQGYEQVTVCRWDGCNAGDLGNMDILVKHIKDAHIGVRQKKYCCEWVDCSRKGTNHASGYALRAHMRSHTREKPFYCALPGEAPLSPCDLYSSLFGLILLSYVLFQLLEVKPSGSTC
jgi:hypothetical protein